MWSRDLYCEEGIKTAIALVDCYAFYCSCERAFNPKVRNVPVGVLSNNDGCVISRTSELKALEVPMGAPFFKVRDFCRKKGAHLFSANFELYTEISKRVFETLNSLCPKVEVYSIDEAFCEIPYHSEKELLIAAEELRKRVWAYTRVPVRIGIGPTKTLAKLAIEVIKKQNDQIQVYNLNPQNQGDEWLSKISIEKVWGVGNRTAKKMKAFGIHRARDLKDYPNQHFIQKHFTKVGRQTQDELRGICCSPITTPEEEYKKGISVTRSFAYTIYTQEELKESLALFSTKACEKLREQGSRCGAISIFCRTSHFGDHPFGVIQGEYRFSAPTEDTRLVIKKAFEVLEKIYEPKLPYKKAGIFLFDLNQQFQTSLFESHEKTEKASKLMETIDQINQQFNKPSIFSLACSRQKNLWQMRQDHLSPRYLASWKELPQSF